MHALDPHPAAEPYPTKLASWPLAASVLLALPICILVVGLVRFYRRFIYTDGSGKLWGLSDDMYISASFGRSLFSGAGFVWYEGAPKVEGISNPLWSIVLGALHRLPWFTEERLGLFVVGLNAVLLAGVVCLFARTAQRALALNIRALHASSRRVPWQVRSTLYALSLAAALLLPWCWGLAYWSAEGFEVALLALLTFAGFDLALMPRTVWRCLALGLLLALGLATRMDFAVLALAVVAVALGHNQGSRVLLLWTAAISLLLVAALLVLRHAYYGDYLPNTYYLETTGWRLASRLHRGLRQNHALLLSGGLAFWPLLLPRVRHNLGRSLPAVVAGLMGFAFAVLYSSYLGGDDWNLFAGYDRHTAAAGVLLCWSCVLFISGAARTWYMRSLCSVWCLLLVAAPVFAESGAKQLRRGLLAVRSPIRSSERDAIHYAKHFREISEPGARIAICRPGAIVYFSHRGGVDLQGKVEPIVSHLRVAEKRPRNTGCWRYAPGQNKADDARVYEAREPEFARDKLPASQRPLYMRIEYNGSTFYVRKGTRLRKPELYAQGSSS